MREFKNLVVGTLCGAVAMVSLTGCAWHKEKTAKETGRTTAQVTTDEHVSDQVAERLKTAPVYKYPDVHVSTYNGAVQLSGFVHNQGQKDEATRIAQEVPGANQVHNALQVEPLTPTGRGNMPNQPYHAPIITPPQNEGSQQNQNPNQAEQQKQQEQQQNEQQQKEQQQNEQQQQQQQQPQPEQNQAQPSPGSQP